MGLFDEILNVAEKANDQINKVKDTIVPIEVQNLAKTSNVILGKIQELEDLDSNGKTIFPDSIIHLRISLMLHFNNLMQGGEPDPYPAGKLHPVYGQAKNDFISLDERLCKLEKKYLQCTFGYQMADGNIVKPSLDWNGNEWLQIQQQSKDQVARCWLDNNQKLYC